MCARSPKSYRFSASICSRPSEDCGCRIASGGGSATSKESSPSRSHPLIATPTIDVVTSRSRIRRDIALYTGNDDNIIGDLVTDWTFSGRKVRFRGGLLGSMGSMDEEGRRTRHPLPRSRDAIADDPERAAH